MNYIFLTLESVLNILKSKLWLFIFSAYCSKGEKKESSVAYERKEKSVSSIASMASTEGSTRVSSDSSPMCLLKRAFKDYRGSFSNLVELRESSVRLTTETACTSRFSSFSNSGCLNSSYELIRNKSAIFFQQD